MLLRIAVAVLDKNQEEKLLKKLIGISMVLKVEFETMIYSSSFAKLTDNLKNIDMTIMDYGFLTMHKDELSEFLKKNYKCLPVIMGNPAERICDFLIIRPIEHIDDVDDIYPESNEDKIKQICTFILDRINSEFENKLDNSVIYITTRQESYAIQKESIIYCQSDLKYTIFIIDDGMIIRKLSKLKEIEDNLLWDFTRIHQSFLVNPKRVNGINKGTNELIMDGGFRIPYSKKYSKTIKEMFIN